MPSINFKKLWRRKSVSITECDPTYKVIYLGNVLTGWAKGDGCVEKPLATLWRNYCQSARPDIPMKVTICGAGLRAVTQEHGLTEYWSHRVTHCSAHPAYPRVFCWVYRHEGRRLKQELRCHAVLCPKQGKAELMSTQLKDRLSMALHEFRREKAIRQNARLSLVHALYDSVAMPMRKVYLITGSANYRPPLERSKSAPKLGAIEEMLEEEEEEEEAPYERVSMAAAAAPPLRTSTTPDRLRVQVTSPRLRGEGVVGLPPSNGRPRRRSRGEMLPLPVPSPPSPRLSLGEEEVVLNLSSPNLLFFPSPPDNLALLDDLRGSDLRAPPEESLTSDQPESLVSSSCSSSQGGSEGEEERSVDDVIMSRDDVMLGKELDKAEEEEDNISEESGYSEDKECIDAGVRINIKV